ncbi:MAG: hypothetical protein GWN62_00680, partial [Aliifodinibius sp.]|nr:hypothetical protein [Fodinibius sp.]
MKFDHKRRVERIFDQGWNKGKFDGLEDLISDDATFHIRNQSIPTSASDLKQIVSQWH